jgi:hypothetical protein
MVGFMRSTPSLVEDLLGGRRQGASVYARFSSFSSLFHG